MEPAGLGIEGFLQLNERIAVYILDLLNKVECGQMRGKDAHTEICKTLEEIDLHISNSNERKVLFLPLCALCEEVKIYIARDFTS